jgi:hypothetical protein
MAGQIEYNYFDWLNRKTELGYWLGQSFQGKGLITKSCRVLIAHAFSELKLNRVDMHCAVENGKAGKWTLGKAKIEVEREDWSTGKGYEMSYIVRKSE